MCLALDQPRRERTLVDVKPSENTKHLMVNARCANDIAGTIECQGVISEVDRFMFLRYQQLRIHDCGCGAWPLLHYCLFKPTKRVHRHTLVAQIETARSLYADSLVVAAATTVCQITSTMISELPTRDNINHKQERYKARKDCKLLYCFVYDPVRSKES